MESNDIVSVSKDRGISLDEYINDPVSRFRLEEIFRLEKVSQYVYFIKLSLEYVTKNLPRSVLGEDVYKVGHTKRFLYERVAEFGPGVKLLNFREVEHSHKTEGIILEELKRLDSSACQLVPGKLEFFQGNRDEINRIFCSVSGNCIKISSESLSELWNKFRQRIRNPNHFRSYQFRVPFRLLPEENDVYRELNELKQENHFKMKFIDLEFQKRYEFARLLDGGYSDVQKAIDMIVI